MTPRIESLKQEIEAVRQVALRRHRAGETARRVVEGLSDSMDGILRSLFLDLMNADVSQVALLAVGGYGRRELCPYSDIDLMFLRDEGKGGDEIERIVRLLWDAGIQLGHSVRTPEECLQYMIDDDVTAAALFESRYLAGSEVLMRRFQDMLNRYRKRHGEDFAQAKLEQLRRSAETPNRTIFVTEPHLKEGMCCLRDIQQILWIERMRRGAATFEEVASRGNFSFEDVRQLAAAYEFYLRVRCELHFTNGLRQDILERDSQLEVARGLGYEGDPPYLAVENLMSDYYRHAWAVLKFARYYLETGSRGTRFLSKVRHRFFSSKVESFLSLLDGRLYLAEEPSGGPEDLGEAILTIFTVAHARHAEVSESLAGWIRRKLSEAPVEFRSAEVYRHFLRVLSGGRNTGLILTRMHETGVLGRILPEFGKLTCLVNFDGHHQFTVDEHTLRALRELDQIETSFDYPEKEFQRILAGIPDRLPLRLALLLHDIGKSSSAPKHDARGTEAAVLICERLGIDEATIETVESLIYLHLMMFRYSERTDFTDERVVESFARLVERIDRLDMLYLLTYIDILSVGSGTWTAWKGAQLADLYGRTRILLTGAPPKSGKLEEAIAAAGFDDEKRAKVLEHCRLMANPAYRRETIPERMAYHVDLVERFIAEGVSQVGLDEQLGYSAVTFVARDRPHLFADFAGVLLSEGLNILGARIFSRTDGIVLDVFQVEIADRIQIDMARRVENLRQKLRKIERGKARVDDLISERAMRYRLRRGAAALLPPRVHFDNEISESSSLIEVDAGDRPGLLFDLASAISAMGLDLRAAKVSTLVDRAHDVFYVVDREGAKVVDPDAQRRIAEALAASAARAAESSGIAPGATSGEGSPNEPEKPSGGGREPAPAAEGT